MLIIEGSDNLGKTILAKKIVRRVSEMGCPVVYSWMTRPNESLFDFFHAYKEMMNPCAVQDRFHLGGLAYHNNKIGTNHLQVINAWIRSIGGLIVVLYGGDEQWYRRRLHEDKRGNLLDVAAMCRGNLIFKNYARRGDCDYAFNILPESLENPLFVSDDDVDELAEEWIHRRRELGIGDI